MSVTAEWRIIRLHFNAVDRQFSQKSHRKPAGKSTMPKSTHLAPPKIMDQSPRWGTLWCSLPRRQSGPKAHPWMAYRYGDSLAQRMSPKCKKAVYSGGKKNTQRNSLLNSSPSSFKRLCMHWGNQIWKRHVYPNVHRSTVYNSQNMEAT